MEPGNPETGRRGEDRKPRSWLWPAIIGGMLLVHVTIWLSFALIAVRDPTVAVEPDYYRKALQWDARRAQDARNLELGWSTTVEAGSQAGIFGEREIRCTVRGREGKPVEGAQVVLVAFAHARANRRIEAQLTEQSPGVYTAVVRMQRKGLWEFRLKARRGDQTFTHVATLDIGTQGGRAAWRR